MTNPEIFTNIKSDESPVTNPTKAYGDIEETVGYTVSPTPSKNADGHYDFSNAQTISETDKNCFAKKVSIKKSKDETKHKYYAKVGIEGFMFNPWGPFSEGTQGDYAKGHGKSAWSFKEVTEKCFNFYIKFLQSKNQAWLKNAEREYR